MVNRKNPNKAPKSRAATAQTVDFKEFLELINTYADTPEWKELPFAGKVRALLRRVLDVEARAEEQKVAAVKRFVQAIARQQRPTEPDCILTAYCLDLDIEDLHVIVDRVLSNGRGSAKETRNVSE